MVNVYTGHGAKAKYAISQETRYAVLIGVDEEVREATEQASTSRAVKTTSFLSLEKASDLSIVYSIRLVRGATPADYKPAAPPLSSTGLSRRRLPP